MDAFGLHFLDALLLDFVHKGRGQHALATIWRQTIPSKQMSSSFFLACLGTVDNTKNIFSKEPTKTIAKLLIQYLGDYKVADDIREMLEIHDRETTSIMMAQSVAKGFREEGFDLDLKKV